MSNIIKEIEELVADGVVEVMLLGQNVNSYGNDLEGDYRFPDLLEDIDKIPGEYLIRFMSSHPKDATNRLFDVMAKCSHVAKQLHLPVQSGNDRVLKEMNRRYTREKYLEEVRYARSVMPGLVITSDIIIGFPGETEAEAMDTVSLVEEVGYDALFTFIYSPRPGTRAAEMPDPATRAEKQKWFDKLLEVQNANSARLHAAYVGKTVRFLAQVCQTNRAGKNSFVPGRFAMTCCVQDIQFVGFPCSYDGYKALEQRAWVTVTAKVNYKFHNIYRGKGPVLTAISVEPAEKPQNDVVTFS